MSNNAVMSTDAVMSTEASDLAADPWQRDVDTVLADPALAPYDPAVRDEVRAAARTAHEAVTAADRRGDRAFEVIAATWMLATLIATLAGAAVVVGGRPTWSWHWIWILLAPWAGLAAVGIATVPFSGTVVWRAEGIAFSRRIALFTRGVTGYILALAAACGWVVAVHWPSGWRGARINAAFLVGWIVLVIVGLYPMFRVEPGRRPDARSYLIVRLVRHLLATAPGPDRQSRQWLAGQLADTGQWVERNLPRAAPRRQPEIRSQLADQGRRIAAGFRRHARSVLLGGTQSDEALAPALAAGLVAAVRGDWETLAAAEPEPLRRRVIVMIGQRGGIVVLLAGLGVLAGSLVPDPQLAGQVRGVLFSSALLALITPVDAVRDVVDGFRGIVGRGRS